MRSTTFLHKQRIEALKKCLSTDWLLVEDPTNLYYLTGLNLSKGRLYVSAGQVVLMVDHRYFELASRTVPYEVVPWGDYFLKGKVAFESDLTTYESYLMLKKAYPHIKGILSPTHEIRAVKDKTELSLLQESATLLNQAYRYIRKKLKVGISEKEISRAFYAYTHQIADGPSFEPIVAFGENGSMPHYRSGNTILKENMAVLLDLGVKHQGYCSDMTRMVTFGVIPKKIEEALKLVKKAKKQAENALAAGGTLGGLQDIAKKALGDQEKYFVHSIGHGIGLDVHELPRKEVFKENMVITIEPGLYYPKIGGVRLEDMYVVTREGYQKLT